MKKILLLFCLLFINFSFSQNIILDGTFGKQNVSACSGSFYDTGGDGTSLDISAFYQDNENDTITICPDQIGKKMGFVVSHYRLQQGDVLYAYDGNTTSSTLLGKYSATGSGYDLSPGDTISTSDDNTSGCITFVFISDSDTKIDQGWKFNLYCYYACQDVYASGTFNGLTPSLRNEPLKICSGQTINMAGFGFYPDMNTINENYTQNNATSNFNWLVIPGDPVVSIPSVNVIGYNATKDSSLAQLTINIPGIYHVQLQIEDSNPIGGCKSVNLVDQVLWVSGAPIFDPIANANLGTRALNGTIALGETDTLIAFAQPTNYTESATPAANGIEYIPDAIDYGSGLVYESKSLFTAYPIDFNTPGSGVINSGNDIVALCLDIEHSSLGDLDITLTCPSGQSVRLLSHSYVENSDLGSPIDIPGMVMGTTSTYCFDMIAPSTMLDAALPLGNIQSVPAGNFLPVDNFSNMIGCEINGNWTLTVKDSRANDNGYAGNWSIIFGPSIQPTYGNSFMNFYIDTNWTEEASNPASGTIISSGTQNDTLIIQPTIAGTYCYTLAVKDEFGCNYDTTICIVAISADIADFEYGNTAICQNSAKFLPTYLNGGQAGTFTISPTTGLNINSTTGEIDPTGAVPGTYVITNTALNPALNPDTHQFSLKIDTQPEISFIVTDDTLCSQVEPSTEAFLQVTNGLAGEFYSFVVTPGDSVNPSAGTLSGSDLTAISLSPTASTAYSVTVISAQNPACVAMSTSPVTLTILPLPVLTMNVFPNDTLCQLDSAIFIATGSNIAFITFTAPPGFPPIENNSTIVMPDSGTYVFSALAYGTNGCPSFSPVSITVQIKSTPDITLAGNYLCTDDSPLILDAVPSGGVFSGTGVVGLTFDPSGLPKGDYLVSYSFGTCSATEVISIDSCLSIKQTDANQFVVYPNPGKGQLTVEMTNLMQFEHILLQDMLGKTVASWPVTSETMTIDTGGFATGSYRLVVRGKSNQISQFLHIQE